MAITPKPRGNVTNYYRDNKSKTLSKQGNDKWISLMITNDSIQNNLILTINDMNITVKAGETFDEDFVDFNTLEIFATDYYRIWLRG
jgi:hypothetical protein